ncbi:MAG: hypothetical protein WC734_06110 [Patescibacteria group bacterium]|jgi:hypothetical protein
MAVKLGELLKKKEVQIGLAVGAIAGIAALVLSQKNGGGIIGATGDGGTGSVDDDAIAAGFEAEAQERENLATQLMSMLDDLVTQFNETIGQIQTESEGQQQQTNSLIESIYTELGGQLNDAYDAINAQSAAYEAALAETVNQLNSALAATETPMDYPFYGEQPGGGEYFYDGGIGGTYADVYGAGSEAFDNLFAPVEPSTGKNAFGFVAGSGAKGFGSAQPQAAAQPTKAETVAARSFTQNILNSGAKTTATVASGLGSLLANVVKSITPTPSKGVGFIAGSGAKDNLTPTVNAGVPPDKQGFQGPSVTIPKVATVAGPKPTPIAQIVTPKSNKPAPGTQLGLITNKNGATGMQYVNASGGISINWSIKENPKFGGSPLATPSVTKQAQSGINVTSSPSNVTKPSSTTPSYIVGVFNQGAPKSTDPGPKTNMQTGVFNPTAPKTTKVTPKATASPVIKGNPTGNQYAM